MQYGIVLNIQLVNGLVGLLGVVGIVVGVLVGGLVGNQFGCGYGCDVVIVIGVFGGVVVGNQIGQQMGVVQGLSSYWIDVQVSDGLMCLFDVWLLGNLCLGDCVQINGNQLLCY